jgi:Skp family chaperone for outer membrane proteins
MNPESIILTAIAVVSAITGLLSLRSNNRRTDTEAKNLEDTITERVLLRSDKEMEKMQRQLDREIALRESERTKADAEIEKLRMELQNERAARGLIEKRLIEAQQRISVLEDERDRYIADNLKKDARIRELEEIKGG